jgi:hypothetical protein
LKFHLLSLVIFIQALSLRFHISELAKKPCPTYFLYCERIEDNAKSNNSIMAKMPGKLLCLIEKFLPRRIATSAVLARLSITP